MVTVLLPSVTAVSVWLLIGFTIFIGSPSRGVADPEALQARQEVNSTGLNDGSAENLTLRKNIKGRYDSNAVTGGVRISQLFREDYCS
jgi:hypothetical protein